MQRRAEMKFRKLDEGPIRRLRSARALSFGGRPDAQASGLAPHSPFAAKRIADGEMEAIEFNPGMKPVRKRLHNLTADKWLSAMGDDVDNDRHNRQERKKTAANPPGPADSASGQGSVHLIFHPFPLDASPPQVAHHFLIRWPMQ